MGGRRTAPDCSFLLCREEVPSQGTWAPQSVKRLALDLGFDPKLTSQAVMIEPGDGVYANRAEPARDSPSLPPSSPPLLALECARARSTHT